VSPLLSPRVSLSSLCLLVAACSTPISPYSPLEDEDEDQDELPVLDAGRDAGAKDAGPRDAGSSDAGVSGSPNCARIARADYYVSLIDDDCSSRTARACAAPGQSPQSAVNQVLMNLAVRCGAPANASLGVGFNPAGCPTYVGATADLRGRITQCIQGELESWRLACTLSCAGTGTFIR
jgi:hypothetical protein